MRKVITLDNYQFNDDKGDIISLYYSHGHDGVKDIYERDLDVSKVLSPKTKTEIKKFFDFERNTSAVDLMGAFIVTCEKLISLYNEYYKKNIDVMNYCYDEYLSIIKEWWISKYNKSISNYHMSFISSFYSFVEAYNRLGNDEVNYDEWILGRLGIPIRCKETKKRTFISFLKIPLKYRPLVKEYIYDRLLVDSVTTCDVRLTALIHFTQYLEMNFPDLNTYELDGHIFSDYYKVILKSNYSQCTKRKYINNLKYFINFCQCNN